MTKNKKKKGCFVNGNKELFIAVAATHAAGVLSAREERRATRFRFDCLQHGILMKKIRNDFIFLGVTLVPLLALSTDWVLRSKVERETAQIVRYNSYKSESHAS